MEALPPKDTALLVHIEHSKPVEVKHFVSSLSALNSLYTSFVKKNCNHPAVSKSELYVEKVENGCIDIYLCELATVGLLPFAENMNLLFEFGGHLKSVYEYFTQGKGEKPRLDLQDYKNLSDVLNIVTNDQKGIMSLGVINKTDVKKEFNNCTFNFNTGNSAQNQFGKETGEIKRMSTDSEYSRVLMVIYQVRNESGANTGNKAIIEEVEGEKKAGLLFETDELKNKILFNPDFNPTKKAFQVDVKVQKINGKTAAYTVTALHDIIDLEEG